MKATPDQERMLALLKLAIDHNTNVMQIAAIEVSGDLSSKNRTHQKKVIEQMLQENDDYRGKLRNIYGQLEKEVEALPKAKKK